MREFKSLKPQRMPEGFDIELHTESPIVTVKESQKRIVVDYSFPGFYLADDTHKVQGKQPGFKRLEIGEVGYLSESGKPLLPSFGRYVQIPRNCDYTVKVHASHPVEFAGISVTPAQMKISDAPGQAPVFEYDAKFYKEDRLYPEEIVTVTGPFQIDEYRALLVHVTPVQYNPAKKKLIGYGDITVTIEVAEKPADTEDTSASPINDPAIGNLLLNPGSGVSQKLGVVVPPVVIKSTGPELLIIYAKIMEQPAKLLAAWKNRRGIITESVCIDAIGNTTPQIKSYLRGRRSQLFTRLRYVTLFGDTDMITPEYNLTTIFGPGQGCSDYYYSTRYDQQSPDPQHPGQKWFLPWLSIGRIPVRTAAEGIGVVNQIITYEKTPPTDPAFYKRITLAAAYQSGRDYLATIDYIYNRLITLGYQVERVYVNDEPGQPTVPPNVPLVNMAQATEMLVKATNDGQLFIGHRDHGNWDGWVIPSFKMTDLDKVTSELPSIFYSINCQTGRYDYTEPTECWAEKNLRMKGTAPSLIAASRNSHTYLNNDLIKAIFDGTFGGVLPTFPGGNISYAVKHNRLGDLLNYGKSYLPTQTTGGDDYIRDHFQIYHVIGDPTLELWTEVPKTISMTARITQGKLYIKLSACPAGGVLTIWQGDTLLKRVEPASTNLTIPLLGLVPVLKSSISLCLWAPGYRCCEARLPLPIILPKAEPRRREPPEAVDLDRFDVPAL